MAPPVAHELDADGVEHILRAHRLQQGLGRSVRGLCRAQRTAEDGERAGTVFVDDGPCLLADLLIRLLPAYLLVVVADLFLRVLYAVAVMLEVLYRSAFSAAVAFGARAVLVRPDIDDPVALDLNLDAAAESAVVTLGLFPNAHIVFSPSDRFVMELNFMHQSMCLAPSARSISEQKTEWAMHNLCKVADCISFRLSN